MKLLEALGVNLGVANITTILYYSGENRAYCYSFFYQYVASNYHHLLHNMHTTSVYNSTCYKIGKLTGTLGLYSYGYMILSLIFHNY